MTSIAGSNILPATAIALVKALENLPHPHKEYYTCQVVDNVAWSCVKGMHPAHNEIWVDICKYQPTSWHQGALARRLKVPKEAVVIVESKTIS